MKRIFTILAMLVCLNASAQGYYEFSHSTGTYTELADPTIITTTFDQAGWAVDLGTSFKMFGIDFPANGEDFTINRFGAVIAENPALDKMFAFDGFLVKNFTARDNTSSISYTFEGTTGSRVLTIQYKNAGLEGGDPGDFVNLQMRLHEDGSRMEVIMGPRQIADVSKVFTFSTDKGPSVGIFLSNIAFTEKDEVFFLTGNPASPSASGMPFVALNGVPAEGKIYTFKHETTTNPATLTLTSPVANEKWKAGETRQITWTSHLVSKIKIEYAHVFNDYNLVAENVDAAPGQYSWVVPNTVSKTCFVRITDMDNPNLSSESGLPFEIQPGSASIGGNVSDERRVSVYPNPTNGRFSIVLPQGMEIINTTLTDLSGRNIPITSKGAQNSIDATGVKAGLYLLNLTTQSDTYTLKIDIR